MKFAQYDPEEFFDEMFASAGAPRAAAHALTQVIDALPPGEIQRRQQSAERALMPMGITFNVYGDDAGTERIFPFDLIPRIVSAAEWRTIERGLKQRIHALNLFINDVYHDRKIIKDGVIPGYVLETAKSLRAQCIGLKPPRGVWCHVTGTDLVRHSDGQMYVLEDNLRCPSGVSYVLENRKVMKRTFPQVFAASRIRPVDDYPSHLRATLEYLAPDGVESPRVVVLTPGHLQLRLLRALVSRAADGRRARRRTRPGRLRRLRLDADHQGLRARGRDLSSHRRRLPRSRRCSGPTRCSACPG